MPRFALVIKTPSEKEGEEKYVHAGLAQKFRLSPHSESTQAEVCTQNFCKDD